MLRGCPFSSQRMVGGGWPEARQLILAGPAPWSIWSWGWTRIWGGESWAMPPARERGGGPHSDYQRDPADP